MLKTNPVKRQKLHTCIFNSFKPNKIINSETCEKGHQREILISVFVDKWSFFKGHFVYLINEKLSKYGLYLHGGLYSELLFNTGLTVLI